MSKFATLIAFSISSMTVLACDDDTTENQPIDSDTDNLDTDSNTTDLCCPAQNTINCGHRGTGINSPENSFPENTIPSFLQAEAEGAQMIELDVHHSADGVLVVIHDHNLETTTDGTGCVGEKTVEQLKSLDAAIGTSQEGTGITIPTLAEALAAISVDVNVEIKVPVGTNCPEPDVKQLAADVVAAIKSDAKNRRIIVSSFSIDVLKEVKNTAPDIYVGYLSFLAATANIATQEGFDAFHVKSTALNDDNIKTVMASGVDVNVWTVNTPEEIEACFRWGVNMIITDEPQIVESSRETWCAALCE